MYTFQEGQNLPDAEVGKLGQSLAPTYSCGTAEHVHVCQNGRCSLSKYVQILTSHNVKYFFLFQTEQDFGSFWLLSLPALPLQHRSQES